MHCTHDCLCCSPRTAVRPLTAVLPYRHLRSLKVHKLTATEFNPLHFLCLGFALSFGTKRLILVVLYDIFLLG
jgi:hypothetical protein